MKKTIEDRFEDKLNEILAEQKDKNIPHFYQNSDKENEFIEEYPDGSKYSIIYDENLNVKLRVKTKD